jgi:NADH-quinone oxidoreductase subunit L
VLPTWAFTTVTIGIVVVGIGVATLLYGLRRVPDTAPDDVSVLTVAARRDLYGDAFNEEVFMRPSAQLTYALVEFDDQGVDGSVNALAALVSRTSDRLRGLQTGFVRNYALSMLVGAAVLVAVAILAVRLW